VSSEFKERVQTVLKPVASGSSIVKEREHSSRIGAGQVDSAGFIYHAQLGRVVCPFCGKFALSRSLPAIRIWKKAHAACCRYRHENQAACA